MNARIFKLSGMIVICLILACYAPIMSIFLSFYTLDTFFY